MVNTYENENDLDHFVNEYKIRDWDCYGIKWYNYWYNSKREQMYYPFEQLFQSNSKFLMDYNMTTPISKLKWYCKKNGIKGYSKMNSNNKNEWIKKIYSQE